MALKLKIQKDSITSDCKTVAISDATGSYNVTTNPEGYGAPNEARSNLYLKLMVHLRKSTGREIISVAAYNENTVSNWSVTISEDGWYELYLFGCKAWGSGITYQTGYITYDLSTDKFYRSLQNSNINHAVTDASWWAEATDIDHFTAAITAGQPDIYDDTDSFVELCVSRKCKAKAFLKAGCDCCDECKLQEYEKIRLKIETAEILEADSNFAEAQRIVESLQAICENLTDCGCH